jgi:hypothetical protein
MLDVLDALTLPAFATCLLALIAACGIAITVPAVASNGRLFTLFLAGIVLAGGMLERLP